MATYSTPSGTRCCAAHAFAAPTSSTRIPGRTYRSSSSENECSFARHVLSSQLRSRVRYGRWASISSSGSYQPCALRHLRPAGDLGALLGDPRQAVVEHARDTVLDRDTSLRSPVQRSPFCASLEAAAADGAAHDVECGDHSVSISTRTPNTARLRCSAVRATQASACSRPDLDERGRSVVALPVAALVIWALLRSPLARRLVAHPSGGALERARRRRRSAASGIFLGLCGRRSSRRSASGDVHAHEELLGILAGAALLFVAGLVDDVYTLPAAVEARRPVRRGRDRALERPVGARSSPTTCSPPQSALLWLVGMTNAFNLLDNMDGLAGHARRDRGDVLRDRRRHRPRGAAAARPLAAASGSPASASCSSTSAPGSPRWSSWATPGSQVLGFTLGALGLATSWKVAETTVATLVLPILVLAVPILDTALVTAVRHAWRGGRSTRAGRTTPRTGSSAAGCPSSGR